LAFKIVISEPKTKRAWQIEKELPSMLGRKIGDSFDGAELGLAGFTLQITGGSDKDGFPMRPEIPGPGRIKALLSGPPGFHPWKEGQRKRKYVRGNTISDAIVQINCKIIAGEGDIPAMLGIKPKEKPKKQEG
jgi:small subunit ribosomal protein S6e